MNCVTDLLDGRRSMTIEEIQLHAYQQPHGMNGRERLPDNSDSAVPVSVSLSTGFQDLPEFLSSDCTAPVLQNRSYLVIENLNPVQNDPTDYLHVGTSQGGSQSSGVNMDLLRELVYHPPC